MRIKGIGAVSVVALLLVVVTSCAYRNPRAGALPKAIELPSDRIAAEQSIRFLEKRVQRDPDDFIAHNKLAGYYLRRVRETGDLTYLNLAARTSRVSLSTMPAEKNSAGLAELAQVEFTSHDFAASRDHARRLAELESDKSYPQQILGDALLELGEYDAARGAYWRMEQLGGARGLTAVASEQRLSRLAALNGDPASATRHMRRATSLALAIPNPPRETVAWCRWQLGELAFSTGDYGAAEQHDRDALITFPGYYRALASLGRVRAARGDISGGIEQYERAVRLLPDPSFVAALGDLYKLNGRNAEAEAQYALVEAIAHLSEMSGNLYNRQQALFLADHDKKLREAYENAAKEYSVRKDIYGADAVAWTALKAGKIHEAEAAIKEALRLGTQDARLFYHAGMIMKAAGDTASAQNYLRRAIQLNPEFDPLQTLIASQALAGLATSDQRNSAAARGAR